jgi:hypothetical protein
MTMAQRHLQEFVGDVMLIDAILPRKIEEGVNVRQD